MIYEEDLTKIDQFIGKRIKLSRSAKGLSSKELARSLEITEDQLLRYELGTDRVPMSELANIARLLKENINFFFPD
ncbi:MAG: helix-turn-helix transcriptional regulator [Candidatus Rickettsia vulgarisii]